MTSNGTGGKRIKFGTDGIRGVANLELTADVALTVGRCVAHYMSVSKKGSARRALVGKDTRVSGDMIETALVAGITSVGVDAWRIGITPTPALAHMTRALNCDCGIMISASHNPVEDNGIKIFSADGYKLEDADEEAIEALIQANGGGIKPAPGAAVGRFVDKSKTAGAYVDYLRRLLRGVFLDGTIVVDCACGAASRYAKRVFKDSAEDVVFINSDEDGLKINVDCGSTKPEIIAAKVRETGAALGFAFDGDADRVLFVDETGTVVDGDQLMLLCARRMKAEGKLAGDTVVATVMSNMGFEAALKDIGARMLRTPVGDKFVLREMLRGGYNIGGEQSGHIIFLDHATTGDGLLSAAQVLRCACASKELFSEQTAMKRSAQFLKNVRVPNRDAFYQSKNIQDKVAEVEKRLGDSGRVVVRPSGTEPLIRVMVETWDAASAESFTDEIIDAVRAEFNIK